MFKIFSLLIFIQFTFFASENVPEKILLTLQYPNSRRISKLWNMNDFNSLSALKIAFLDMSGHGQIPSQFLLKLLKEDTHVTHEYLKELIAGNCSSGNLEKYIQDYLYFIGENDMDLYGKNPTTVKNKILREHIFTLSKKLNQPLIQNFFNYDFKNFLQNNLNIDFENFSKTTLASDKDNYTMSVNGIIDLIKPSIIIEISNMNRSGGFSMSIASNRHIIVNNPCLVNLIQLIAWKKYLENQNEILNDLQLQDRYSRLFEYQTKIIKKICFKNFIFLNLSLEKILDITRNISFINSSVTISDNDIAALQKIRDANITKPYNPLDSYGPYWQRFNTCGDRYRKHSLAIDFSTSHIKNPDKALSLIDIYNGYFQTIVLKNIPINKKELWFKKLLCRKFARLKFCVSIVINILILGFLFGKGGLILKGCTILIGGPLSFIIQVLLHERIIKYPETAAHEYTKEPFDTNGGVTFE